MHVSDRNQQTVADKLHVGDLSVLRSQLIRRVGQVEDRKWQESETVLLLGCNSTLLRLRARLAGAERQKQEERKKSDRQSPQKVHVTVFFCPLPSSV